MTYCLYVFGDVQPFCKRGRVKQELHNSYDDACKRLAAIWREHKKEPWRYPYSSSLFYCIISTSNSEESKAMLIGRMKPKSKHRQDTIWDAAFKEPEKYQGVLALLPWMDK